MLFALLVLLFSVVDAKDWGGVGAVESLIDYILEFWKICGIFSLFHKLMLGFGYF